MASGGATPDGAASAMLALEGVTMRFGARTVLDGVSLRVTRGSTRVVLGLSGSGKSVLMKLMIGLLRPSAGRILVDGRDIVPMSRPDLLAVRRAFGMVFQQAALFDSMTVAENVAFPLQEHSSLRGRARAARVTELLSAVELADAADRYPAELSGGMRKRVGLARALVLEPACLLYDEPTTGLDPLTTAAVDELIRSTQRRLGVTSVVISHDIGSALSIADEVAVLHEGRIVEDCAAAALPRSEQRFVQSFLAATQRAPRPPT